MRVPVVVDFRNLYSSDAMRAHGFDYVCVGRGQKRAGEDAPMDQDGRAVIRMPAARHDGGARFIA